jgi:hypothetical protein
MSHIIQKRSENRIPNLAVFFTHPCKGLISARWRGFSTSLKITYPLLEEYAATILNLPG